MPRQTRADGSTDIDSTDRPSGDAGTRRQNLAAILTLLHRSGPLQRSRLTERTGRNRSTVAALVGELAERGLVFETDADPTRQVGRPSPLVSPNPGNVAIAVNPEVDAISIGVVGLGGRVVRRIRYETEDPPSAREVVRISAAVIEGLRGEFESGGTIHGIGVAVPGLVRATDGLVRWAPHLGWTDVPLAGLLAEATGFPVTVGNDASLGAVAEHIFGAGRGESDLVYLNGGASGIGGGVIAGGVLIGGAEGYAGEFGHVRVPADGAQSGSLEAAVRRSDLAGALGLPSIDADGLEQALRENSEPAVGELVHRQVDYLSVSISNVVNVLNPRLIVLGGFLASLLEREPEFLRERVREQSVSASFAAATITRAELGSDLLMIGAAELVFARLLADPSRPAAFR